MSHDLFADGGLGFSIPPEAVRNLMAEWRAADAKAKEFTDKAAGIARKIAAIRELAPELFDAETPRRAINLETSLTAEPQKKTVIDAVVDAVDRVGRPLLPKEIRAAVFEQGDGDLITNENYIYTAIKRATESGRIRRVGETYKSASQAEGPGE